MQLFYPINLDGFAYFWRYHLKPFGCEQHSQSYLSVVTGSRGSFKVP
jgi:hypothetical protein